MPAALVGLALGAFASGVAFTVLWFTDGAELQAELDDGHGPVEHNGRCCDQVTR
jgi:hypothetical protein